jgi:outer membrane protein assembly factor BamB
VWTHEGRTEIVTSATGGVRAYDLEGREVWHLRGMSSITIPTPFEADGRLYLASGYVGDQSRPVYAIRPGAAGDISLTAGASSNAFVSWSLPQAAPYNPSPLVYRGVYYTLLDRGLVTAHDAATGKELYGRQRIDPAAGAFTASPWAANGLIFALNEDGDTYVMKAGPAFEVVRKNTIGELTLASPALARGSIILRTSSNVYRLAQRSRDYLRNRN